MTITFTILCYQIIRRMMIDDVFTYDDHFSLLLFFSALTWCMNVRSVLPLFLDPPVVLYFLICCVSCLIVSYLNKNKWQNDLQNLLQNGFHTVFWVCQTKELYNLKSEGGGLRWKNAKKRVAKNWTKKYLCKEEKNSPITIGTGKNRAIEKILSPLPPIMSGCFLKERKITTPSQVKWSTINMFSKLPWRHALLTVMLRTIRW